MGDPTDGADVGHPRKRFRVSFWVCFLPSTLMFQTPIALTGLALFAFYGVADVLLIVLFAGTTIAVSYAIYSAQEMYQKAPVVGPLGIDCMGFWHTRYFAPWGAVTEVRPRNWLGVVYLRVYATGVADPLWVPVQVADPAGFADAVREYAGDDHLLTQALDERLARGAEE